MSEKEDVVKELINLANVNSMDPLFIHRLRDLKAVLDGFDYYEQDTEPTIEDESWAIWRDTSRNITIFLIRSDDTQEGVEVA